MLTGDEDRKGWCLVCGHPLNAAEHCEFCCTDDKCEECDEENGDEEKTVSP